MSDTANRTKNQAPAMIERVARLMCARRGWNPDARESGLIPGKEPDGLFAWEIVREANLAGVIEAISEAGYVIVPREPTEAMIEAGRNIAVGVLVQSINPKAVRVLTYTGAEEWRAMIDAALDESR